ncbi:unnamed protein product, partial [marine sediment metagenome]
MAKRIGRVFYWDSCIFIALLSNEQRPHDEMQGVRAIANANNKKENIIITSSITRTEIFKENQVNDDFKKVLQRSNVIEVSADPKITDKAGTIRRRANSA